MNSRERILKAFNHEEPDRVPTFCQVVMPIFKKRLENLWGKDFKKDRKLIFFDKDHNYAKKLGFDCEWSSQGYSINIPDDYMKENPLPTLDNPEFSIDIDGRIFKKGSLEITNEWYVKNYITTEEKADYFYDTYWNVEWETYPNTIKMLNRKLRRFPTDDFVPTCALHAILEPIWEGLGFALLAKLLRKKKDKIKRYIDLRTKIAIEHAKLMVESDYEIFHLCDDTAFKNNTMIDPAIHRELVVPAYKKIIQEIKKKGKIAFFHSDGFTEPYFDGLIEAGFDGIESLEPMAGMDLKYLKEKYGDKICLIGNIDVSQLLPYGSTEDVRMMVKKCIKDAGEGGGYILSPCTDITNSCKVENVLAMLDAVKKYGQYPLKL